MPRPRERVCLQDGYSKRATLLKLRLRGSRTCDRPPLAGVDGVIGPVLVDPGAEAGRTELESYSSRPLPRAGSISLVVYRQEGQT